METPCIPAIWQLVAVTLGLAPLGCSSNDEPSGLQGVVEHEQVRLAFETGGTIVRVKVERGAAVHAGDPLASLDETVMQRVVEAREAEVEALESELALLQAGTRVEDVSATAARLDAARAVEELAQTQLARQQQLVDQGVVGAATLDELEQRLAQARGERQALVQELLAKQRGSRPQQIDALSARLRAAAAAREADHERLSLYRIHAPTDGIVEWVHVEPGEVASPGAPIVTLIDRERPYVDVFVPQGELDGLELGRGASVRIDAIEHAFEGAIEHISAQTEFTPHYLFSPEERGNLVVRVRVRLEDPNHELPAGVPAFTTWKSAH